MLSLPGPTRHRAARVILLALLALSSCARRQAEAVPEPPRRGFIVPAQGTLILTIEKDGSLAPMSQETLRRTSPAQGMAPFPISCTAASIQPLPGGAVLAINRAGLKRLLVTRHPPLEGGISAETRLLIDDLAETDHEFAGRTVAPSWGMEGQAIFLLYRHPIFETSEPRDPPSKTLSATLSGASVRDVGLEGDAYAVYPVSVDSWLVQYRSESGERIHTGYSRVFTDAGQPESLARSEFERLASPLPMALAPEALLTAAGSLSGPLLIEARMHDGSRRAYVRGDPGQATPAWAWLPPEDNNNPYESSLCIVTDDWRVVTARQTDDRLIISTSSPSAPVSGAVVRDASIVEGLIVALWEEDFFPYVGRSGIMVIDPAL